MTDKEQLKIESYLLDRENPNYEIAEKVMGVIEEFERCRKILVDVAETVAPHATIPVVIKIGDNEIHSKSMNDYEKLLKSISSEAIKEFTKLLSRRLNSNTPRGAYLLNIISEVKKEMVGDNSA